MNDQTAKVLEQLANKLGTTADYLWSVLLRQAYINSFICLVYIGLTILLGFILYKSHVFLNDSTNKISYYKIEERTYGNYEEENMSIMVLMGALAFIWFIFLIVSLFSIDEIITGFVNPEYWALNEILKALGK